MTSHFWIIETPKSIVDRQLHRHIIYRLTKPDNYVAGPFETEGKAIDELEIIEVCKLLETETDPKKRFGLKCYLGDLMDSPHRQFKG